jgi:hypothetical protein
VRSEREKLLPEALLDLPEVGRLPSEGGPMHLTEGGEPGRGTNPRSDGGRRGGCLCRCLCAEEFSDDLDGEDLRVGERGCGSTASETQPLEPVVHEAKDGHDEGAKIHKKKASFTPVGLVATERREVFSLVQALKETCTRG